MEGESKTVSELRLALLWPRMPEKSARENLRQTLYQLRKAILEAAGSEGEHVPFILSDRQQIWVNPDARHALDVAAFKALIREEEPATLAKAVKLYWGDFLADFYLEDSNRFEEWAAGWRGRLRRQELNALDQLGAYHLERGGAAEAARYARRQLELDNLRESAHRQLIAALGQMGRLIFSQARVKAANRSTIPGRTICYNRRRR